MGVSELVRQNRIMHTALARLAMDPAEPSAPADPQSSASAALRCAYGDAAPTLPDDLPSWVSMHATATGADLIEHDPNGEVWERSIAGEWWANHVGNAIPERTYLVRRRPVPVEPTTEKVPWGVDLIGRRVGGQPEPINFVGSDRAYGYCDTEVVWFAKCPPDGMVTVLREDGAS